MLTTRAAAGGAPVYFKTILAVALGLRLGVVWMVLFRYPKNWLFSNSPDLGFLAQSLSSGHGLCSPFGGSTGPTAFLAPGYPAILGLIFYLFGSYSFTAAALMLALQTLFAVLTVAVILQAARRMFGAPTANLAGTFWAVSPPLIWLPAVLWDTGLSALLLLGMVALALCCVDKPGAALWAAMGAHCGLAMLVNPSLTLALFAVVSWAGWQTRSMGRSGPWLCLLVWLAVFAPWPMRNARVLHAIIPLRSNFGYEVWQGNHPGGSGLFDKSIEPLENQQEYRSYAAKGEVAYMRNKSTLAQSYIRSHPGEFLRHSAMRLARFWTGSGLPTNSAVVEGHVVITSLLGLAGLAALFRRQCAVGVLFLLPLLLFPLPYYVTHPESRFRMVLDPLLTILSAYAVTRLGPIGRSRATHDEEPYPVAASKGCYSGSNGRSSDRPR